jgi:hypothetical protein
MAKRGEVIIEFYRVGAFVKVSAVDTATFIEVSIVGDPACGEEALKRAVLQKLEYILERRGKGTAQPGGVVV